MRLRWQLAVIVFVVAIVAVGVQGALYGMQAADDLQASRHKEADGVARTAAAQLDALLAAALRSLEAAAAAIPQEDLLRGDQDSIARSVDPLLMAEFNAVTVVDAAGHLIFSRPADMKAFAHAAASELIVADGVVAWQTVRVTTEGPFTVQGALHPSLIVDALARHTPAEGDLWLRHAGQTLHGTTLAPASTHRSATGAAVVADGVFEIVAAVPAVGPMAVPAQLIGLSLGVAAVVVGISVVAGVFMARSVAVPAERLSATVHRMRRGDLGARVKLAGAVEMRQLGHDVNQLADTLGKERSRLTRFQHRLEETVALRTAQLQQEMKSLEQFAYIVSHDLRSPLRAVSLSLCRIRDEVDRGDMDGARERLQEAGQRLARADALIESILRFARTGRPTERSDPVDMSALLAEVIHGARVPAGFKVQVAGPVPELAGDPVQLRQVLQNLIDNALAHHDGDSGSVALSAHAGRRMATVVVEDDGPGVPPEQRERIFGMFTHGESSGGTGIGLALVRRMVEVHGGVVQVHAREPRGSIFAFTWPLAVARSENHAAARL